MRRLHRRDKLSEREIAKRTGLSRNTVAKWLRAEVDEPPKYRRVTTSTKLTLFEETLRASLKADAKRARHERRTARALFAQIRAMGYDGGYSRVTDFVRAWRHAEGQAGAGKMIARSWHGSKRSRRAVTVTNHMSNFLTHRLCRQGRETYSRTPRQNGYSSDHQKARSN